MIGVLLIFVAYFLFIEVKSLLIGEAVDEETEKMLRDIILRTEAVDKIIDLRTLYVGPMELFIAMKVIIGKDDDAVVITKTINEIEAEIRQEIPIANMIYIEPDLLRNDTK